MQFLVYVTVLMVSMAVVLLEVHWLTSPSPQPKPAIQTTAGRTPPPKVDGPNAALSPVYPKRLEPPSPADPANEQAQSSANGVTAKAPDETGQTATAELAPLQKAPPETTGMASRGQSQSQTNVDAANAANRVNNPQQPVPAALPSNNRCDVPACASAYRSFRASDCTYQPFGGERRVCANPPTQRTARDQRDDSERRRWIGEAEVPRAAEQRARDFVDDDDGPEFNEVERGPRFFLFGGQRRW
jgi:hypothetical protein